eukprot:365679-Chlamydomonas_euryale.AAC.7
MLGGAPAAGPGDAQRSAPSTAATPRGEPGSVREPADCRRILALKPPPSVRRMPAELGDSRRDGELSWPAGLPRRLLLGRLLLGRLLLGRPLDSDAADARPCGEGGPCTSAAPDASGNRLDDTSSCCCCCCRRCCCCC